MRRRSLLGAGAVALAFPAPSIVRAQGTAAGVALVIGNSKYQWEAPLPNVRRDAPDIAERFKALGLKTELIQDADGATMRAAVNRLRAAAQGQKLAAFYFAGHGVAQRRDNFIVPLEADFSAPKFMDTLIPSNMVLGAMRGAASRLAVFDSCRNNPADGALQLETERAAGMMHDVTAQKIAENPNALSLFSTPPGSIALDGPAGENSPFAATLLRQLGAQTIDLQALPQKIRRDLLIATQGRQVLWDMNGFTAPYAIAGPKTGVAATSSGGVDASRVMELPRVYAMAQQGGYPLPPGLVAIRAPASSPDARKVGSYAFEVRMPNGKISPQVFIVLSAADSKAQVIQAGINEAGTFWSFRLANISGSKLDLVPRAGAPRFTFDFSDANSGTLSLMMEGGGPRMAGGPNNRMGGGPGGGFGPQQGGSGPQQGRPGGSQVKFTRLDG